MDTDQFASIVRDASRKAVDCYLQMCGLDSPWEVPEAFFAAEAAKALADAGFRVAVEFRLDRASNAPTVTDIAQAPARLQRAYAHLDVAILKRDADHPWALTLDGIVEFKKHSSLANDASLIDFMIAQKGITYGVLALLVVGSSERRVRDEYSRLTMDLPRWRLFSAVKAVPYLPSLPNSMVGDRWWDICCLIAR